MTDAQRHILRHALGIREHSITVDRIACPDWPWRNRYATAPDCDSWSDVQVLVEAQLMAKNQYCLGGGMDVFHVTKQGIQEALTGIVVDE